MVPGIEDKINGHLFQCKVSLLGFGVSSEGRVHLVDGS